MQKIWNKAVKSISTYSRVLYNYVLSMHVVSVQILDFIILTNRDHDDKKAKAVKSCCKDE